jgi:hypothetical protein
VTRTSIAIAVGSAAVTIAGSTVLAVTPSVAAGHANKTLRYKTSPPAALSLKNGNSLSVAVLRTIKHGKVKHKNGILTFSCRPAGTGLLSCYESVALSGGLLFGKATINFYSNTVSGKITGGSGNYAHAKGTLKSAVLSKGHAGVTIKYKR